MNSNIEKVMFNKYLKSEMIFNNQSNFSLPESMNNYEFKMAKVAAKYFLKNKTNEELLNSEVGVYVVEALVQRYVKGIPYKSSIICQI